MHNGETLIEIKGLYKSFGSLKVLKGVSTEIKAGEVVSIIGASGSGKSTLLRCMNLLEKPTYGEVWMEGKLLTPVDPYLHPDVIACSKTYKKLTNGAEVNDKSVSVDGNAVTDALYTDEAIAKIKSEDLLNEKYSSAEGNEYKAKMKKIYNDNYMI